MVGLDVCCTDAEAPDLDAGVVAALAAVVDDDEVSGPFLFRRIELSFSALSITTLAIRSNSEQTPNIR